MNNYTNLHFDRNYKKIQNINTDISFPCWPPDFPKYSIESNIAELMLEQMQFADLPKEDIINKISNAKTLNDYKELYSIFDLASSAQHKNNCPNSPICQWVFEIIWGPKMYWLAREAELGDWGALYDLIDIMIFNGEFSDDQAKKALLYLGEKGISRAYKKLAFEYQIGDKEINHAKVVDCDKCESKYYFLKAKSCINSDISLSDYEKDLEIIEINRYLVLYGLENKELYNESIQIADRIVNENNKEKILEIIDLCEYAEIDGNYSYPLAFKYLAKYKELFGADEEYLKRISFYNSKIESKKSDSVIKTTKKGCYVATCVYGSYDCSQVWRLRRYRDYYLDSKWYGRLFIKLYYSISPKLVKMFGEKKWFKHFAKSILDKKLIKLEKHGYLDTPYDDKY